MLAFFLYIFGDRLSMDLLPILQIQLVSTLHAATSARHCPSITAMSLLGFLNASPLRLMAVPLSSAGVKSELGGCIF
jgi:hypothetical protein